MCSASAIFWMWSWASCAQMTRMTRSGSLLWVKFEWAQRILKHFGFFQCRVEFQACWICFKFLSSPSIKPLQSCFFYHRNTSRIIFYLPFSLFFLTSMSSFSKFTKRAEIKTSSRPKSHACTSADSRRRRRRLTDWTEGGRERSVKRCSEEEEEL